MQTIAIVDAYSSANMLAPIFSKRGVTPIHVQSTLEIPFIYRRSFHPKDFHKNILHLGSPQDTLQRLKDFGVDQVIVGIESGVELADTLSEMLGCYSNGTALSEARRHKYKMVEALKEKGIRHIPSLLTRELSEALSWSDGKYPVVCKPPKSAGTDNVIVCDTSDELENAFGLILGAKNRLDLTNDDVLVQEYVVGREFCVDVVSFEGSVVPTAILESEKLNHGGSRLYDREFFVPFESETAQSLFSYACKVVDALGIRFGPAHLEIMLTESGPVLIEVGARIIGSGFPLVQQLCLGQNHAHLTAECYMDQAKFLARLGKGYQIKKNLLRVCMISDVTGEFAGFRYMNELRQLPGFYQISTNIEEGDQIEISSNLFNIPGLVDFIHSDWATLEKNYQQLRQWEKEGMYELK